MRGFVWGLEHVGDKGEEGDLEPDLCINPGESQWGDEGRLCFQYDSQELMMLGFVCKEKRGVKMHFLALVWGRQNYKQGICPGEGGGKQVSVARLGTCWSQPVNNQPVAGLARLVLIVATRRLQQ